MRWQVHGERTVYDSPWLRVVLADVESPDGMRVPEHHVVRAPRHVGGCVVSDPARGVLMLWRHRFITDTWGWECPAGRLEEGETPAEAAARETVEETGWTPGPLTPLASWHPSQGLLDQTFHAFHADGASWAGPPTDTHEAERVEWVSLDDLAGLLDRGEVVDGFSLVALLSFLRRRAVG